MVSKCWRIWTATIVGAVVFSAALPGFAKNTQAPDAEAKINLSITLRRDVKNYTFSNFYTAIDFAKNVKKRSPTAQLRFAVGNGIVHLPTPILLGAELSGTPSAPTLITIQLGAKAELRASRRVKLDWKPYAGGLWVAQITDGEFDQVWINGEKQVLARYPNYDAKVEPLNGYAADALSPQRTMRWSHPEDGVIRAIHSSRWGGVAIPIEGRNIDGSLKLGAPVGNNRVNPPQDAPNPLYRYVEGVFEELDSPGEWYLDPRTHSIYIMPKPGVDLSKSSVEVSTSDSIVRIVGDRKMPVHDIILSGLIFSHARDTFLQATEPLLRSDWKVARDGAVFIQGGERVQILDSDFQDLGGQAVFVSGYNRQVRISGNLFSNIGGTAISFVGLPSAVRNPLFEYGQSLPLSQIDRTPGPLTDDYPADSKADDNLIHDIGRSDKQAAGIEISMAMNITLAHNSIYHVPRSGINIGDGTWGGHVIEHNDVFDTVLETGDHGAFNSWGRDRYWVSDRKEMDARVAAMPELPYLDVVRPIVLRNNRFQSDHGWDIDLDDGSSNYEIYNNVMLTGGLKLREGFGRKVSNNIIINNSLHPHVWFANSADLFVHNIVMSPYQPILMPHWSQPIDYNLFPTQKALKEAQDLGLDTHSMFGDSQFVDVKSGDYRVKRTSPALALGFKNFPMDFGVRSPRLRAQAAQVQPPVLLTQSAGSQGATADFFGAKVKSVETLGEQSAAGLGEIKGVLVLSVGSNTPAARASLQAGDVLLSIVNVYDNTRYGADIPIDNLLDLTQAMQARKWQTVMTLQIQRNQALTTVDIKF